MDDISVCAGRDRKETITISPENEILLRRSTILHNLEKDKRKNPGTWYKNTRKNMSIGLEIAKLFFALLRS